MPPICRALCFVLLAWIITGLGCVSSVGHALKVPFRVNDVLPVLPRGISWPVLNNLHSAVDLLPYFVGSVTPSNGSIQWKGACFYENKASLEFTPGEPDPEAHEPPLGGAILYLKTEAAHSWTCMDLYVFATPYRITWDYYFSSREHTLKFDSWEEPAELEYVKQHGVSVFLMPSGMLGTLLSLIDVLPLFSNTVWGQKANLDFLKKHMGATFEKRSRPWQATIDPADVHSGDFLAVSKIRGRWGGFETLEKWVTGSFAGHTAVCLKDEMGNLWVGESGHENEKGEEIIVVIPWEEWWELTLKDSSNPQIALLPLHPELRAKFNSTAAWEYARSMSGKPYGYHNMIFSWIDTVADNYPPPLDAHLVISVMSMWTRLQPAYSANMWNEALNKRLGTEGLDLHDIIVETEKRGIPFDQLLTIPEQDEWVYSDGKSTTCVAFILSMYKEAGIFGPVSSSIQVTEFTIRDAYMLRIFEDNQTRLPSWCNNENDQLPFCQILGEYRMELPGYNTLDPYANMNEHCPSLPPTYDRPSQYMDTIDAKAITLSPHSSIVTTHFICEMCNKGFKRDPNLQLQREFSIYNFMEVPIDQLPMFWSLLGICFSMIRANKCGLAAHVIFGLHGLPQLFLTNYGVQCLIEGTGFPFSLFKQSKGYNGYTSSKHATYGEQSIKPNESSL